MKSISEGVKRKSLEHLIEPKISIDEYESKISDKRVIVVGFYCGDKDPANDLSMFIDSSSLPILDTEVSPAPTPTGHYVVWVEVARSKEFPEILNQLLKEIDNLTDVDSWKFVCPAQQNEQELDKKNLTKFLILDPAKILDPPEEEPEEEPKDEETPEEPTDEETPETSSEDETQELAEFWRFSLADRIELTENAITFYKNSQSRKFEVSRSIPESINLLAETHETKMMKSLLGPAYNVFHTDDGVVVESSNIAIHLKAVDID